jgi:hypothetical protein
MLHLPYADHCRPGSKSFRSPDQFKISASVGPIDPVENNYSTVVSNLNLVNPMCCQCQVRHNVSSTTAECIIPHAMECTFISLELHSGSFERLQCSGAFTSDSIFRSTSET